MNQTEFLKPKEGLSKTGEEQVGPQGVLSPKEAMEICKIRQEALEGLKHVITLKFYHQITEKLSQEKLAFEKLLNLETAKQTVLSQYSFVLNPYYFEQKFIQ